MTNQVDTEIEEVEISGKKTRRRLVLYCVLSYVILMITVPFCHIYLPDLLYSLPCPFHMSVPLLNFRYHPNGSVEDSGELYLAAHVFTIYGTLRGCRCQFKPCIRKCCGKNQYFVSAPKVPKKCVTNPGPSLFNNFSVPVYLHPEELAYVENDYFDILYGDVCANTKFELNPKLYPTDLHFLLTSGHILHDGKNLDTSKYCLESKNGSDAIHTYECFEKDSQANVMFKLYPPFLLLSSVFLVFTFIVYSIIPDFRNLHGKCLMSFVASLFATNIGVSIEHSKTKSMPKLPCTMLAFVVEFTFLASFFWMNVMCFDIWWVFSGLRAPRGSAKERDHKKFLLYSLYAWGVPAIILAISLVMDLVPFIPDSFIKPGFGIKKCWFYDRSGILLYFYLPIAVVVVLNIAMFVSTACRLKAHTKETKVLHGSESRQNTKADKDRFNLYLKLFVVMGINWVMELVSFLVGGPKSLWYVTDIGNTLQGLMIFLIFVCKRRVFRLVAQKLCPGRLSSLGSKSGPSQSNTSSTLVSKTTQ